MEGGYTQQERDFIFDWCNEHLLGKDNARHRENKECPNKGILPYMPVSINDRKFRRIFNDIGPEQGFYSSSSRGYWVLPLCTNDQDEIDAALGALGERAAKAVSTIEKVNYHTKQLEVRKQKQGELPLCQRK